MSGATIRLSVCISTHERPHLLPRVLQGLAAQSRAPDDIVCVDSSRTERSAAIVTAFNASPCGPKVHYVRSTRRALPWNRWQGCLHAAGDVVLFLDDDVRLQPDALAVLDRAYTDRHRQTGRPPAGVGFLLAWDDGRQPVRDCGELRERWLGTSTRPGGTLTDGGLPVSSAGLTAAEPIEVSHLWGGAMSFRREVLLRIGCLEELAVLYDAGWGRAEDIVLSTLAARHGALYLITQSLARHPIQADRTSTPYPVYGWNVGMTQTWGRAHSLRWLARDPVAYRRAWWRVVLLELGRSVGGLLRRPWKLANWTRLGGAIWGVARALAGWRRIPSTPTRHQPDRTEADGTVTVP
jgi:glycosyltransferase involved in cell wall biosynthesis